MSFGTFQRRSLFVFALDDSTFFQLFEARKVLEVGIVDLAAERITDEEIDELKQCLETSLENVDDHQAFLEADLELHERITKAAGNPILQRLMTSVSRLGRASRRRTVEIPGVPDQSVEDHRAIVEALEQRDAAAAREAMLRHLNHVEARLERLASSDTEK